MMLAEIFGAWIVVFLTLCIFSYLYDDNPFYVKLIKDHGVFVFQPVMSEKYLKEFETADPFFTCNLQKMQFDYLENLEDSEMKK